jgi:hypothetical protein
LPRIHGKKVYTDLPKTLHSFFLVEFRLQTGIGHRSCLHKLQEVSTSTAIVLVSRLFVEGRAGIAVLSLRLVLGANSWGNLVTQLGDGKSQEEIKLARRRLSTMNDKAASADDLSVGNMSIEDNKEGVSS